MGNWKTKASGRNGKQRKTSGSGRTAELTVSKKCADKAEKMKQEALKIEKGEREG